MNVEQQYIDLFSQTEAMICKHRAEAVSYPHLIQKLTNMDYKDIEQLLERYWQCETSVEEESVLRDFFSKEDVYKRQVPISFDKEQCWIEIDE